MDVAGKLTLFKVTVAVTIIEFKHLSAFAASTINLKKKLKILRTVNDLTVR